MPVILETVDAGLRRTTDLVPASLDYTAMWWVYLPAAPGPGVTRTLYFTANSAARATQSIAVAQDDTGTVRLVVAGTPSTGAVLGTGWHALATLRRAGTGFLGLLADGGYISSATAAISGWALDELYLGVDPRASGAASSVAYYREWAADTGGYLTEWASPVPVRTADLEAATPLAADLLDTTAHHHDWTAVGGGPVTFTAVAAADGGAFGGWWFSSGWMTPLNAPTCFLRVTAGGAILAEARAELQATTGGVDSVTGVQYDIFLRGGTGGEIVAHDPIPDPAIGYIVPPAFATAGPREDFAIPWRWALTFACSTYDPATATYAADGTVRLWLNDSALLTMSALLLPYRPNGTALTYTVGIWGDCDRVWARTVATVPPTTGEGAFTEGPPSALLFADDFDGGGYAAWTEVSLFAGGGAVVPAQAHADGGGADGWGLSVYHVGPTVGDASNVAAYAGLSRTLWFPPLPLDGDDPGGGGGDGETPVPPDVAPSYHLDARYIRRLRRAPHVAHEQSRVFYRRFELDLERGQGLATGQGSEPSVLLRISRDGGQTWGEEIRMAAGHLGDYTTRVLARRLGQARDTVFEVVVSDPIAWSLVGAWLDLEPGTN